MTTTSTTRRLVLAATVVSGLSFSVDRALVVTPAWLHLGVQAWANFSRHADLGTGDIVYPVGGILTWGLVFAAAVSHRLAPSRPRPAGPPIYLAALASLGAIATTLIAAPVMQRVGHLSDSDLAALRHAFGTFTLWGVYVRSAFFMLIFVCNVWALAAISRHQPSPLIASHKNSGGTTP